MGEDQRMLGYAELADLAMRSMGREASEVERDLGETEARHSKFRVHSSILSEGSAIEPRRFQT